VPGRPHWGDCFEFWSGGDVADVITHAKFCVNWFRGFRVLTPPILPFSIGLAGCPYNGVRTAMLLRDGLNNPAKIDFLMKNLLTEPCIKDGVGT